MCPPRSFPSDTELSDDDREGLERRRVQVAQRPALTALAHPRLLLRARALWPRLTSQRQVNPSAAANGTSAFGWEDQVTVCGRVRSVQIGSVAGRSLEVQVFDETGGIQLLFFGRTSIPGLAPGALVRRRAGGGVPRSSGRGESTV